MRLSVTFRHLEPSDSLKDYVGQKLEKLAKHFDHEMDAVAVLSVEKFRQIVEITVSSGKSTAKCTEETNDMYQSIDKVIDKLERKVRRSREKVRKKGQDSDHLILHGQVEYESDNVEWEERLLKMDKSEAKSMSIDEATIYLQLNKNNEYVLFTIGQADKVNVMYRRKDGKFGLIETTRE